MNNPGKTDYVIRILCWVGGFLLVLGISSGSIGASCFVCFLIIISSVREMHFIMTKKRINKVYWLCTDWLLLGAAYAYIGTNSFFLKLFFISCMFLCIYIKLYRTCYYEKLSWKHVKHIICDFPLLCLYNISGFWHEKEPFEFKEKRHKIVVGIFILLILAVGIFLPLYIAIDSEVGELAMAVLWSIADKIPIVIICAVLGLIPAMVNYSLIKGLIEDLIYQNPERLMAETNSINFRGLFFNDVVLRIVLWGLTFLNLLLVVLQVNFLLRYQLYEHNMENLYDLQGGLPLLLAIILSLFFVSLSGYAIKLDYAKKLRFVTLFYILTLCAMTILLLYRYVLKIMNSGIDNMNLLGLGCSLLLLLIFWLFIYYVSQIGVNIWKRAVVLGTVLFLLAVTIPVEYIVSNINVYIFLNKYENGEIGNVVSEEDINLEYLDEMGYDSISALAKLAGVTSKYGATEKSVQETAGEILADYFFSGLTRAEQEELSGLETEEKLQQLIAMLENKPVYQMAGRKQTAFNKLKEFQKKFISE